MGKYNFDKVWERTGRNASKWDFNPMEPRKTDPNFTPLPLWVADMDFATAPSVVEAMQERLNHPLFGYYGDPDRYFNAIYKWQKERFGVTGLKKEHIGYENGVLGGVAAVLHTLTKPGDPILVHSPTYVGFTGVLKNNDMDIVSSPLVQDENGVYRMVLRIWRKRSRKKAPRCDFLQPSQSHRPCLDQRRDPAIISI